VKFVRMLFQDNEWSNYWQLGILDPSYPKAHLCGWSFQPGEGPEDPDAAASTVSERPRDAREPTRDELDCLVVQLNALVKETP
jgi:hypothetical protein